MTESLTTTQVAKKCGVCHRTVRKWCETGMLKSWKVPGSKHRRIEPDDLAWFMKKHNVPNTEKK